MNKEVLYLAKVIWDYHHVNHKLEKSDIIMVLGSHDMSVASRGIELFKQGLSGKILFSGGVGRLTSLDINFNGTTEADVFAKKAIEEGIPTKDIIIENKSTNTGENIRFSFELIKDLGINSVILVQKPYMERRTLATFLKQRPGSNVSFSVTSPQISFENYINGEIPAEKIIDIMVGDLQRIIEYPNKGFQIYQEVPENIISAYKRLMALGFTKSLILK